MSTTRFIIRKNQYFDSVFLMGINKKLLSESGVLQSAVLMGTQNNKKLLANIDVVNSEIDQASANDLIVAVIAETEQYAQLALHKLDQLMDRADTVSASQLDFLTLEDGIQAEPDANLAVISVPGEFAAHEARTALENGLNVFLFSSNVSVEDELGLKQTASDNNLLVMGPDCGTSIIAGKGIGFANRVRQGLVGVIGPSGTGLQEFTCLIHHFGSGISHAIGTGSRDLKDEIGGLTTLKALDMLEKDKTTEIVSIVSKPAEKKTLSKLIKRLDNYEKPVIACFLGISKTPTSTNEKLTFTKTIDEAAEKTVSLATGKGPQKRYQLEKSLIDHEAASFSPQQKYIRGLFAGGTFCYQSQQILLASGFPLNSNEPLGKSKLLQNPDHSIGHTLIDMGDEFYTMGKPHPMIDGTMRNIRISQEAADPETAVILLDFILGFNTSNDPVGESIDAIILAKQNANSQNRHLTIIASITGTEDDVQDMRLQRKLLEDAGVIVTHSNAAATQICTRLLKTKGEAK